MSLRMGVGRQSAAEKDEIGRFWPQGRRDERGMLEMLKVE
jgi:hypothetical protein